MKHTLNQAQRNELWSIYKDAKLHISEVIIRFEELVGKILEEERAQWKKGCETVQE